MADAKPKPEAPAKEAAPATPAAAAEAAPKKRGGKTIGIVAAVMIVEGLAIFFVMKSMGSHPDPVAAAEEHAPTTKKVEHDEVELNLVQLRALNIKSGRPVLYGIKVFVRVEADKSEAVKALLEKKKATIEDAVARIVRSADPSHLTEDGLETLRRQIQYELGRITNDESCIGEILIPECTPYPTGF